MQETDKIKSLSFEELKTTFVELLPKMGFNDVIVENDTVYATRNDGFINNSYAFIITDSRLSGEATQDIGPMIERLNTIQTTSDSAVTVLVSRFPISAGYRRKISQNTINTVNFWGYDILHKYLSEYYKAFFRHKDKNLSAYEQDFIDTHKRDDLLRILNLPSEKYKKLLDIYISPTLYRHYKNPKSEKPGIERFKIQDLISTDEPIFLHGISGAGKSTLLRKIGCEIIEQNQKQSDKKTIPIYISALELNTPCIEIKAIILSKVASIAADIDSLISNYDVTILVDSIDEFSEETQKRFIKELNSLARKGFRYIVSTRQGSALSTLSKEKNKIITIAPFNWDQVHRFISAFLSDEAKSNSLLKALYDNKLIDRLPITPLTLSLISLLYEDKSYEIPATLSDIYDRFHELIMGRSFVSRKIDFLTVNFRETILNSYGYEILKRPNHFPMTVDEFFGHYEKEFLKILPRETTPVVIHEALEYMIRNTGILYIKDNKYVSFTQNIYMEYYASKEIFNNRRPEEDEYIHNFYDVNWQNSAVFYVGRTKRMNEFALKVNDKVKSATFLRDHFLSVQGVGYLLQAMYLADTDVSSQLIISALENAIQCFDLMKRTLTTKVTMLKKLDVPFFAFLTFVHFYSMFNSVTLREPLVKAFEALEKEYLLIRKKDPASGKLVNLGFKLLDLAFTLSSERVSSKTQLDKLINKEEYSAILNDPLLYRIADMSVFLLDRNVDEEIRKELMEDKEKRREIQNLMCGMSAFKFRLSAFDTLHPDKKVLILTEGETDTLLIDHAYMVLTGGAVPYWKSSQATPNDKTGNCKSVKNTLEDMIGVDPEEIVIGIFDYDNAGISQYMQIKNNVEEAEKHSIKKLGGKDIYALMLPVPGEMRHYIKDRQEFNFFEIEHYFGHEYLIEKEMVNKTEFPNIYEIRSHKKMEFAKEMEKIDDPKIFSLFKDLFLKIDQITGFQSRYII